MKIYISQPMRGRTREQILDMRERGKAALLCFFPDAEFIDSYIEDYDDTISPIKYLSRTVDLMSQADVVAFLPETVCCGNEGCEVEDHICEVYRIPRFSMRFRIGMEEYVPEEEPPADGYMDFPVVGGE